MLIPHIFKSLPILQKCQKLSFVLLYINHIYKHLLRVHQKFDENNAKFELEISFLIKIVGNLCLLLIKYPETLKHITHTLLHMHTHTCTLTHIPGNKL